MPDNVVRNYLELVQVSKALDDIDSIAAVRLGLTAAEGELVRTKLDVRRSELVREIKEQVDAYFPEAGKDLVIESTSFDWKRARKPTGYIFPIGKRDITAVLAMQPADTTDNRMSDVWSFTAAWPGSEAEPDTCAIWDWDGSSENGKWYCYGDVDIMRRLFGRRYVYTALEGEKA